MVSDNKCGTKLDNGPDYTRPAKAQAQETSKTEAGEWKLLAKIIDLLSKCDGSEQYISSQIWKYLNKNIMGKLQVIRRKHKVF